MNRKKEDPEKVKKRVKKYLETKKQLLITGLTGEEKIKFEQLTAMSDISHAQKLKLLMDFWNKSKEENMEVKAPVRESNLVYYPFKGSESVSGIFPYNKKEVSTKLPIFMSGVSAGFPSPADDYIEDRLNLDDMLVKNPSSTFFTKVNGNSMIKAGIFHDDILVVDRSEKPLNGKVVIAVVDGELTVKRLLLEKRKVFLVAENDDYPTIEIKEEMDFEIWGVVIAVIHRP